MTDQPIKHGGNLREAAKQYHTPLENWLDLSTGINPNGWLPPEIPPQVWLRLPEDDDGLLAAAQSYYGVKNILPVAGSQAAIQSLPYCRATSRVGIVSPTYAEYEYCWRLAGHSVITIHRNEVEQQLHNFDVLIIINPNNPDTYLHQSEVLKHYQEELAKHGGWLIVDEAFIDSTPEHSLLRYDLDTMPNLIILRSLGKFFGLAGVRLGFVIATPTLLEQIKLQQGSWSISHPTRWIGNLALQDKVWQENTRESLAKASKEMKQALSTFNLHNLSHTSLFFYFQLSNAKQFQDHLAQKGVWVRHFSQPQSIRIGLVKNKTELEVLTQSILTFFLEQSKNQQQ